MMLKNVAIATAIVFLLAGCSSGGDSGGGKGGGSVDSAAAEKSFKQNCASCHGNNLEGGTGPALKQIGKEHSKDEIMKQIKNGGGGMPAGLINGDEAENVAAWLASKK
ncbi:c-type cytochrome [Fictibacillus fluitans]|uniref:Cytochrome c n=1 Tax=Fictibacillus fluitans TaxID=3058422 RepID=A0ABT8I160_9BACL|nr:cytochrome c [Fictibacillus sp. NE201]MDN4526756.1 cytochrome c [Fictibacillus sp. NE201]